MIDTDRTHFTDEYISEQRVIPIVDYIILFSAIPDLSYIKKIDVLQQCQLPISDKGPFIRYGVQCGNDEIHIKQHQLHYI